MTNCRCDHSRYAHAGFGGRCHLCTCDQLTLPVARVPAWLADEYDPDDRTDPLAPRFESVAVLLGRDGAQAWYAELDS